MAILHISVNILYVLSLVVLCSLFWKHALPTGQSLWPKIWSSAITAKKPISEIWSRYYVHIFCLYWWSLNVVNHKTLAHHGGYSINLKAFVIRGFVRAPSITIKLRYFAFFWCVVKMKIHEPTLRSRLWKSVSKGIIRLDCVLSAVTREIMRGWTSWAKTLTFIVTLQYLSYILPLYVR